MRRITWRPTPPETPSRAHRPRHPTSSTGYLFIMRRVTWRPSHPPETPVTGCTGRLFLMRRTTWRDPSNLATTPTELPPARASLARRASRRRPTDGPARPPPEGSPPIATAAHAEFNFLNLVPLSRWTGRACWRYASPATRRGLTRRPRRTRFRLLNSP